MGNLLTVILPMACLIGCSSAGKTGLGVALAAVILAVMLLVKRWRNFCEKHPMLASINKAICCLIGILFILFLSMAGVPIIPLAVGAVLLIGGINFLSKSHQRDKEKTQEFLDDFHDEMQRDVTDYRRRKKLDEEKRKAARAEAEHLEDLARLWERNAQKYRTTKDIRKAREYREQADAAWRKIR